MAMGESLGHGARRTQNNGSDYASGDFPKSVHLTLMGDPTLRLFPVVPPTGLIQVSMVGKVSLSWTGSSDSSIQGYAIYRGDIDARQNGVFNRLNSELVTTNSYDDLSVVSGTDYTYMVRAVKLETSASGTYLNSSQGVFVDATAVSSISPEITITGNSQSITDGETGTSASDHTAFGNAIINNESVSRTFTIRNDGDATLSLSGSPLVQLSGSHASDFTVTRQPSKSSLAPAESTTFVVRFGPTAMGTRSAIVTLTSNDTNEGTFTFAISGSGDPQPVPEITITCNSQSITYGATGTSVSDHTAFGNAIINNETVSRTFTIRNDGDATLSLSGSPLVQLSGSHTSDFSVTSQPSKSSLAPAESTTFVVRFGPTALGIRSAVVTLTSNDTSEGTFTFAISGSGDPQPVPEITITGNSQSIAYGSTSTSASNHTAFGNAIINNETVSRTFTIRNDGDATLSLSGSPLVQLTGSHASDFTVTSRPSKSSLAPAESTTFVVRFGPTALGSRSAAVTVASNDSDEGSYTFVISGTGEQIPPEPEIVITGNEQSIVDGSVTTSEINFTNFGAFVPGDSTQIRRYRIQNIGEGLLGLGSPMILGEGFLISNLTSSVLTQGATAEFQVSFPGGLPSGEYLATVTIPNNDPDESNFTFTVRAKNLNALELWRLQNFGES